MRVLLVDDEPFITQGLKLLIDWQAEDCEIAGCVQNGEEAIAFLQKEKLKKSQHFSVQHLIQEANE